MRKDSPDFNPDAAHYEAPDGEVFQGDAMASEYAAYIAPKAKSGKADKAEGE